MKPIARRLPLLALVLLPLAGPVHAQYDAQRQMQIQRLQQDQNRQQLQRQQQQHETQRQQHELQRLQEQDRLRELRAPPGQQQGQERYLQDPLLRQRENQLR